MRRILVVEDHPLVAEATKSLFLAMSIDQVEVCHCAQDAMARLAETDDWFRIFLDVGVPGADGLSLIRHVGQRGLASRSAVVTASENPQWRADIESMGFLGYVVKTANVQEFNFALQEIIDGRPHFQRKKFDARTTHLTRKQTEILGLLDQGLSTADIARRLRLPLGGVGNSIAAIVHALRASDQPRADHIEQRLAGHAAPEASGPGR